jgi:membrane associated rhomboid family serine protease
MVFRLTIPARGFSKPQAIRMFTYLIIAINVVISLIAFANMNTAGRRGQAFLFWPSEVAAGRNYPGVVLSHFSHADGGHLLFNMITLYFFGPEVEFDLGAPSMLLIYIVAGIASTLYIYSRHRDDPNYRALGASDSVTAIIFAAIVLRPGLSVAFLFVPIPIPGPVFAIGYILISTYFMRREGGHISHEAHLAGAFTGLVLAGLLNPAGFGPLLRRIQSLLGG